MATPLQIATLEAEYKQAEASDHIFPAFAACEAMAESGWGTTECYQQANNPFGVQAYEGCQYPNEVIAGAWEVVNGQRVPRTEHFVVYPDEITAYNDRMRILRADRKKYPEYDAALRALSGAEFIINVSKRWSTDPNKARVVLAIYFEHRHLFD